MRSDIESAVRNAAAKHGMEAAALLAVVDIESAGAPFEPADGQTPQFLFERHIFYAQLKQRAPGKLQAAINQGLAHANWQPSTQYKDQNTSAHRLALLARAVAVDADCAYRACSWGLGQTMGFQAEHLGYDSAEHMVAAMRGSIPAQVEAMIGEIKYSKIDDDLAAHRWATFARGYNGAGYRKNEYDTRLAQAYARWAHPGEDNTPTPSDDVKWLQTALNSAGAAISVDGFDGPKTESAVKAFQAAHGLVVDGIAGTLTVAALKAAQSIPPLGKEGEKKGGSPLLPQKPLPKTQTGGTTMSTIPVTSPINASPDVAAVVNAAVTPIKALWSSITGMFSSVAFGGLGAAVSVLAPNLSVEILGGIGVLAALVSAIAHAYAIINGVAATNNATIVLAENFLNKIEVGLGGKPLVFANDPTSATA